jgi:adenylate cyclase
VPPAVAAALALKDDGPAVVESGGVRYLVSFAALKGTQDWRAGVIGPEDYYLAEPRRVRQLVSVAAALLLCFVGMLLAFAAAAARRGLERVVAESERMRRFDFEPSTATSAFADIGAVLVDLEQAKTALRGLARYAPLDLVRKLYADNREPKLGGELRLVTLLFTDIEGFTSFAETTPPERLALLLGHYFAALTGAVTATGGAVDKYIGDALMVLWNAPTACAEHAARACRAALACVAAADALFDSPAWAGAPRLHTRFGIHSDEVMVGHFGAPERFSYTALGDGVNLAARLEALNKQYGTTILVSGAVVAAIGDEFALRRLDRVAVKGKSRGIDVYELLGYASDASRVATARRYEAALDAYFARDFAAAIALLEALPDDAPSTRLRDRCALLRDDPPPADWNGVHTAKSK